MDETKDVLFRSLKANRDALYAKLDGVSERDARMPMTPTGTNLLGLVKHVALVQIGYFAVTFGVHSPDMAFWGMEDDPNADLYASDDESMDDIRALWTRCCALTDSQIAALPLDAAGIVPWWPEDRRYVTLFDVLVHVIPEVARHAGHADIVREMIDGSAGLNPANSNLPDTDWPAHVAKLKAIAESR